LVSQRFVFGVRRGWVRIKKFCWRTWMQYLFF
jgi:hypothetical protein